MTARILVVDDILANVRLLEAKLSAEYFEVVTAMNGVDALEAVQRAKPDIVLLDVMMPGIDGIEVCKRLKADPATQHIPVIMVTALDQLEDRVRGLEAGADDFLTKPVNDVALFCRIKSLVRLKMLSDELRARAESSQSMGLVVKRAIPVDPRPGNILVVDSRVAFIDRVRVALTGTHKVSGVIDPLEVIPTITESATPYELVIVNLDAEQFDGLRLCSQLKSLEQTRQIPILIVVAPDDEQRLMRALDMGVNDYLIRPIDRQELMARVNTQIRRARYAEQLRVSVQTSIEMAVTDALTGLYNRRYMETHLGHLVEHSINRGKPLSALAIDVDFFKPVNDTHGHDVGDKVLQELASRIRDNIRNVDMPCRVGGEEFIIILPATELHLAQKIAERIRKSIAGKPFSAGADGGSLNITVSVGLSTLIGANDKLEDFLKRADQALYIAKREGRNRVTHIAA
ncbi:MAG TPA: PleD family two-component system response regulator [Aestuariivirga sp.]|nr:PleD family two-component system response regulator [Aestuariivirga sp.]